MDANSTNLALGDPPFWTIFYGRLSHAAPPEHDRASRRRSPRIDCEQLTATSQARHRRTGIAMERGVVVIC